MEELGSMKIYNDLIAKVEIFAHSIHEKFPAGINCSKGCSECCSLEEVLPIEAYAILAPIMQDKIDKNHLPEIADYEEGKCVFLKNDGCSIYDARPISCRAMGYPSKTGDHVGNCRLNFKDKPDFDEENILDMDNIDASLDSINMLFCEETEEGVFGEGKVSLRTLLESIKSIP